MRNLPLTTGFSAVEIGYPCRLPGIWFDDFIGFGQTSSASGTALTGIYKIGGTNAVVASYDITAAPVSTGGSATTNVGTDSCGVIEIATTATSGDEAFLELSGGAFLCTTGRQMVFQCRFRLDTITTTTQWMGMCAPVVTSSAEPINNLVAGFGFQIVNGVVNYTVKSAAGTTAATALGVTLTASTTTGWHVGQIRWDGKDAISFSMDGSTPVVTRSNVPTAIYLTPCVGLDTASSASKTMKLDYIYAGVEAPAGGR